MVGLVILPRLLSWFSLGWYFRLLLVGILDSLWLAIRFRFWWQCGFPLVVRVMSAARFRGGEIGHRMALGSPVSRGGFGPPVYRVRLGLGATRSRAFTQSSLGRSRPTSAWYRGDFSRYLLMCAESVFDTSPQWLQITSCSTLQLYVEDRSLRGRVGRAWSHSLGS